MSYGAHVIEMNEIFVPRRRPSRTRSEPMRPSTKIFLLMMAATLALAILAPITVLAA